MRLAALALLLLSGCATGACDAALGGAIPPPAAAQWLEGQDRAVCLKLSAPLPLGAWAAKRRLP